MSNNQLIHMTLSPWFDDSFPRPAGAVMIIPPPYWFTVFPAVMGGMFNTLGHKPAHCTNCIPGVGRARAA